MARIEDLLSGQYLKASDLIGREAVVRLSHMTEEQMPEQDGKAGEMKYVAYFVGKQKGVVLNKTNIGVLSDLGLEDTEHIPPDFPALVLYSVKVQFGAKMVDGLRMRQHTAGGQAPPVREPEYPVDDVPF